MFHLYQNANANTMARRRSTITNAVGRSDTSRTSVVDIELSSLQEQYADTIESSTEQISKPSQRTIDEFLDEAYEDSSERFPWRFWLIFVAMGMGNFGDAVELSSIGYLLSDEVFDSDILQHDLKHKASVIASASHMGMILGGLLAGAFENSLGRKRFVLTGLLLNAVSCFASAFAPNAGLFAFFRFCAGLGIGTFSSSLMPLSTELSPSDKRGFCVTLVNSFWSVGMIYLNVVAFLVLDVESWGWRVFIGMTGFPSMLAFLLILLIVPESARSLALKGDFDGAAKSLNGLVDGLNYGGEKMSSDEIQHHFENNYIIKENQSLPLRGALKNIKVLFSPSLLKKTLTVQMIWVVLEMTSSIGPWFNKIFIYAGASEYVGSLFLAIGSMLGGLIGATFLDGVGRQTTLSASLTIVASTTVALAWIVHSDAVHMALIMLCVCIWSTMLSTAWNANHVITGEVFPTQVRGSAAGLAAAVGRTAMVGLQFANGALADNPISLLTFISIIAAFGAVSTKACHPKEMANLPLEDTITSSEIVDGIEIVPTSQTYTKIESGVSVDSLEETEGKMEFV